MLFGFGILKGLAITFKNFVGSYFMPADKGGIFTVETASPIPHRYPNRRPVANNFYSMIARHGTKLVAISMNPAFRR